MQINLLKLRTGLSVPFCFLFLTIALAAPRPGMAGERVYPVGGDVLSPQQISACRPRWPAPSKGQTIEQSFFVYEVVISASGKVESVKLVRQSRRGKPYDDLEKAFRRSIETCAYHPATRQGKPVACRMKMIATAEVW